jgi:hypothetical protein
MEKEKGSIDTSKAVCGPAVRPNAQDSVNQNSNDGQPRVGELFFINHEVGNISLSSMSSDPSEYTETEIVENLTDYPVIVDYALSIAASTNTSVSSVTHNDIVRKKFNSRSILAAFKRRASSDLTGSSVNRDCEAHPGSIPKDWCNNTDPAVNNSSDPTIDIENQSSQEESSSAVDEKSVPSKSQNSLPSFSDGFGGYIYQNCSELNSRRTMLLIMIALVLLLFGISAVIAAVISDSNPNNADASNNQMTSFYESPTVTTSTSSSSAASQSAFPPTAIDSVALLQTNPKTSVTDTSNDESEVLFGTDPSTSAPNTSSVNSSATEAASYSTASSSTTSTLTITSSITSAAASLTTTSSTTSAAASLPTTSLTTSAVSSLTTTSSTTSAVASSTTTTSSSMTSSSTISSTAKTSSPPSKLSATYLQAVANSLMKSPSTNVKKVDKEDDKGNDDKEDDTGKVDKEDDKGKGDKEDDKGKDVVSVAMDVVSVVRFDVSPMLNDPRGQPFKVLMRLQSSISNTAGLGKISVEYLPKAGLWNCSPCQEEQVPSINSIAVGSTSDDTGRSAYLDMSLAFSRGIFDQQMTFKLYSSGFISAPELIILWVEGNIDDFSGMSLTSLLEKVSGQGS